ncbi:unnamed protein product [Cunninghamella blakesleeana]
MTVKNLDEIVSFISPPDIFEVETMDELCEYVEDYHNFKKIISWSNVFIAN